MASDYDYSWLDAEDSDLAVCRQMLRDGSHSFYAASLLLPWEYREPACALYAFCRLADDAIDDGTGDADALARLQARLDHIYAGTPFDHPADRAMVHIARVYGMPRELPEALIDGFRWDIGGRRYDSIEDLYDYCARVAGSVGAMMAVLMGVRDPTVLARACELGTAMQLTNIARDVGEDARNGRIYLPLDWLREAGIDIVAFLDDPQPSPALAGVIQRLILDADKLYLRARTGIPQLPLGCRPGIYAAMRIYREIGVQLRHNGCDSVTTRTVVSRGRKSFLLGHAMLSTIRGKALSQEPPLEANRFLVESVGRAAAPMTVAERWFAT
ncbi:MAG: phytoene/squalene synthase family protein [Pseudomonadota bacterium]